MPTPQARDRRFKQVDVFTPTRYSGNALAVVLDASGLDDEAMQRFARWTHLSETTFLLPPTQAAADYRVRIFTPHSELPFAGHPTLGSCHAWLEAGGVPKQKDLVLQECGVGLVAIRQEAPRLAFAAPPVKRSPLEPAHLAGITQALGLLPQQVLAAQVLDNGPVWVSLLLDDPQTVLRLTPDHGQLKALGHKIGVAAVDKDAARDGAISPMLEVRAFLAAIGIEEDPVTGSLNASLAQWLIAECRLPESYVAAQGSRLGRAGRVHIERDANGRVWVGGESVTCISGTVAL